MQECVLVSTELLTNPMKHVRTGPQEYVGAIVDEEMCMLLEYKQLIKHPQYKNI